MDPRERADAMLARARARGAFVVTPESAVSPMDQANTLQIPRIVVDENDGRPRDSEAATLVVPVPGSPENVPAIAQEAPTGVVDSPAIRSRQRRVEDARARGTARQQAADAESEAHTPPTGIQQSMSGADLFTPATPDPPDTGSLSQRLEG